MRFYEMEDNDVASASDDNGDELARFIVLYGKATTKKHKTYECDGILCCFSRFCILKSEDEKNVISRSTTIKSIEELTDGLAIKMGSWEVQIQNRIDVPTAKSERLPDTSIPSTDAKRKFTPLATTFSNSPNVSIPPPFKRFCSGRSFVSPVVGHTEKSPLFILNENEVKNGARPVYVEQSIGRHLRAHQKEGVQFIYTSIAGPSGGAILADEMGLGKSVQLIASTWAFLNSQPLLSKCLLVVPSTLVNNWKAEFKKWFRGGRIPMIDVKKSEDIEKFRTVCKYSPYLVISYEMALRCVGKLSSLKFDIIACDEAHRLKNSGSKLHKALASLAIGRRILLTGTPLQNDLDEFFALLDFAQPGKFGTLSEFRKRGAENDTTLSEQISQAILRRTSEVNDSHLPEKHQYVVFCLPAELQKKMLCAVCDHMTGEPLVLIDYMRKVSNHPWLLYQKLMKLEEKSIYAVLRAVFPKDFGTIGPMLGDSGKLSTLLEMLVTFRLREECTVVVSNYTKTLDLLCKLCLKLGLGVIRLDGQTAISERQSIVSKFNSERDPKKVFFLSTKAGGVGLNLIGASRLILFDSDWNPASDLQAMGRIWRDGQTRPCHIYRLATAGTIDEKIFQRQIKKTGLSSIVECLDNESTGNVKFRDEDLLDIFNIVDTECNTHDLLECSCNGDGILPEERNDECDEEIDENEAELNETECNPADIDESSADQLDDGESETSKASMAELYRWRHYSPNCGKTWDMFTERSGIPNCPDVTFALHYCSKF